MPHELRDGSTVSSSLACLVAPQHWIRKSPQLINSLSQPSIARSTPHHQHHSLTPYHQHHSIDTIPSAPLVDTTPSPSHHLTNPAPSGDELVRATRLYAPLFFHQSGCSPTTISDGLPAINRYGFPTVKCSPPLTTFCLSPRPGGAAVASPEASQGVEQGVGGSVSDSLKAANKALISKIRCGCWCVWVWGGGWV